jgi:protein O-GlcNAc transferase
MAELFERHDRSRFEVVGYSYGIDDGSPMRARLARAFDDFVDIRAFSHRQAAGAIYGRGTDILVDLKGYTHEARPAITAQRPALVQVSYLGYPATMGADFVDYLMVESFVVPADQQPFFSEQLLHLPGCYQVNDRNVRSQPEVPPGRNVACPRTEWSFAASTTAIRFRRGFLTSGCACSEACREASCGCSVRTVWCKAT